MLQEKHFCERYMDTKGFFLFNLKSQLWRHSRVLTIFWKMAARRLQLWQYVRSLEVAQIEYVMNTYVHTYFYLERGI